MNSPVSRRGLLRAAAAVAGLAAAGAAAGCDLIGSKPSQDPAEEVSPQLVDVLRNAVVLGATYDQAATRAPGIADRLHALRENHRTHVQTLSQALGVATPTAGASLGGAEDEAAVVAALVQLETAGVDAARAACLAAPDRLAPLIGSVAAARSCHLLVLEVLQ